MIVFFFFSVAGVSDSISVQTEDDESIGLAVLGTCLKSLAITSATAEEVNFEMVCASGKWVDYRATDDGCFTAAVVRVLVAGGV